MTTPLDTLAERHGISLHFYEIDGTYHGVSDETKRALLDGLRHTRRHGRGGRTKPFDGAGGPRDRHARPGRTGAASCPRTWLSAGSGASRCSSINCAPRATGVSATSPISPTRHGWPPPRGRISSAPIRCTRCSRPSRSARARSFLPTAASSTRSTSPSTSCPASTRPWSMHDRLESARSGDMVDYEAVSDLKYRGAPQGLDGLERDALAAA